MSKRHAREHGRILSVDEETLGSVLVADAASGATTLTVDDAAEFEDDGTGGWLSVNDQVIEYDTVDDDAGTIHLKTALSAAADDGDPVYVWSKLYDTAATVKTALVMVDGEDDNTDPVHAVLADAVQDLPEGLRGGTDGEACTLVRVSEDEWEVTAVGGAPSSVKGSRAVKFEANDVYILTAADIAAGVATMPLSQRPIDESIDARWTTVPQEPTEYTVDYAAQSITWPLEGFEMAGDRLWVHYEYRVGVVTGAALSLYLEYRAPATGDSHQLVLALPDGSAYTSPVISNSTTFPQLIDLGAIGDPGSVGVTLRNVTRGTQYTYPNAAAFSTESVSGAGWAGIRYKCEDQPGGLGDNGQYSDLWFQIRGATQ